MKDLHHFYSARKNDYTNKCEVLKSAIKRIAFARIIVALLILLVVYQAFSQPIYWYAVASFILSFLFLVSKHGKTQTQYDLNNKLIRLNSLEILALRQDYSSFGDGQQFSDPHHAYSYDLDLFGPASLFQYVNRCGTEIGEERLATDLMRPQSSKEAILERQEAIKELSKDVELRQWFWAKGHTLVDNIKENESLFEWLIEQNVVFGKFVYQVLLILFPIFSVALIALTIFSSAYFPLLFLFAGIQWLILSFKSKEVSKAEKALSHHKKLFDKYSQLLQRTAQSEFAGARLRSIQHEAQEASERILKFSRLVNAFESRKNAIANLFGNSLYLYDLQCLYRLEKWRSANHTMVKDWLDKIAEIDALISLATFHFNNQSNTFPTLENAAHIQATEMGHPLIALDERVNNSFSIGKPENIMLITGANMAGKSTFLRTVGINLVLALSGSSVCAKEFTFPLVDLYTSMRATDSLVDHQSYFYAELSRLKIIMEQVRSKKPTIVLLDEILRGTNSKDKQEGSIGLLNQFVSYQALVILASHDVVLGELENKFPNSIRNYCFESELANDALVFDYTLHKGIAHKANATFLMQQMGILPTKKD